MSYNETRYMTFGIPLSEWDVFFFGWIDEDDVIYDDVKESWIESDG